MTSTRFLSLPASSDAPGTSSQASTIEASLSVAPRRNSADAIASRSAGSAWRIQRGRSFRSSTIASAGSSLHQCGHWDRTSFMFGPSRSSTPRHVATLITLLLPVGPGLGDRKVCRHSHGTGQIHLIGYRACMERPTIIEIARKARGWTQRELALAAGTSQPTLSAYERREKSPSLAVTERLTGEAGYTLRLDVTVDFTQVTFNGHD